jgi:ABC-2 type transport system permease protein
MMRLLPAGSLPWLLAHELRLAYRGRAGRARWAPILMLVMLTVMGLVAGLPLGLYLRGNPPGLDPANVMLVDGLVLFLFCLFISTTLSMTVQAFFERGDFDLVLSSPLPPSRVLFVRCLAVAANPLLLQLAIMTPILLPVAALANPRFLGAYGVLAAAALLSATAGLALAMGLFRLLGPRRTKTVGQVLAAVIGAAVFLTFQIPNLLPGYAPQFKTVLTAMRASHLFDAASPLSWPARAAFGETVPLAAIFGASLVLFYVLTRMLGAGFAAAAAAAQGATAEAGRKRDTRPLRGFTGGVMRRLMVKELRLIGRDPALISQVLLQVLYFIPMAVVLMRLTFIPSLPVKLAAGAAGMVVFFVGQISGSLAWIAVSGEDAPDLIKSAPVGAARARRAKLMSAFLPVMALALAPAGFLFWVHPFAGAMTLLGVAAAAVSVALVTLWYERPQPRSNFRRRGQSSLAVTFGEMGLNFSLMFTTAAAAAGTPWALAVAVIPAGLLGLLYLGRTRDDATD